MACNKNEWHPVHWINYWISTIAKIPSTEQDGGINVMSIGRNGSSLAWMDDYYSLAWMTTRHTSKGEIFKYPYKMGLDDYY